MNFRDFILQLSSDELVEYAKKAKTTTGYLKSHLLYGYKEPRRNLRKALAEASNGKVSEAEVLHHFGLCPSQPVHSLNGNKASA